MSKIFNLFVKNFIKKEVKTMKRMLGILVVFGIVSGFVGTALAATSDIGYVVVRCTGTLSVMVGNVDGTNDDGDEVNLWDLTTSSPNAVVVSTQIAVTNNGVGVISRWKLAVTGQQQGTDGVTWAATDGSYPSWGYDGQDTDDCGANKIALKAVFASAQATQSDFNNSEDIVDAGERDYTTAALVYGPATGGSQYATTVVSGNSYNMVAPSSTRNLYFKVRLPSAVTDQRYRRIAVTVTASEGL
ncbi:MAG: hypothetical protein A3J83_00630 [Elusimicrobia bacterium RIFOXYA2_FULL_40_6]|nr:MAG: hypothetical protein A3J83_00630 [Elusimicrobia bacterium RIFOXYA2_FULL_40_6]